MSLGLLTEIPATNFLPRDIQIDDFSRLILSGVTQSGKTSLIFYHLLEKRNFLYIDFDEVNIEETLKNIKKIVSEHRAKILVLDIYNYPIENKLEDILSIKNLSLIIVSWRYFEFDCFSNVKLKPLNFEEFISFKSGIESIEHSFLRYSQIGGFPIFAKYSDNFLFKHVKRLLYFALSDLEIAILEDIANNIGVSRTRFNIFTSLREKRKVSKDKIYPTIEKLERDGFIIAVKEFERINNKRYYLIDQAIQNSFSKKRNFLQLFENMVISEVYKRGEEGIFLNNVDLFIEEDLRIILPLPFVERDTLQRAIQKRLKNIKKLRAKKVEIITMSFDAVFSFENIDIEAIKFTSWALSR